MDEYEAKYAAESGNEIPAHQQADEHDARVLQNLGYKQQLNRTFGFMSSLGLTTTVMATWEAYSVTFTTVLMNGGPVALIYGFFFAFIGTLCTCASLAEYASMSPTSAAQYRWAAELAPRKHFRIVSWVFGWITFWGWQLTTASPAYLAATMIQALAVLNYPDTYVYQQYHGTLIYWCIILLGVVVNVGFAKWLPRLEGFLFIWHVVGFFAVLIPLVYLAPQTSAEFVFSSTVNSGQWPNYGISFCVGLIVNTFPFVGYDAACHMSEEVKEPTIVLPRAMIGTIIVNGLLGFGMILALLFSLGNLDEVLKAPVSLAGYPVIEIYHQATKSVHGANAMTSVSLVIVIMAHFGLMAGCSRTAWAFARDRGLPASGYFAHVSETSQVPFRAIMLSVVIQVLLGLINIGSSAAFLAFINAAAAALYITYITPVILGVMKRWRGEYIPYGPFQLGKYRDVINGFAIVYTLFTTFFLLWPAMQNPSAAEMNWTILLIGGVLVFAAFWWFVEGRKSFVGPNIDATLNQHKE
ncbi:hypothetical protein LTR37_004970 [Vermiconidia calcicola]|uniref:Uncharacterized protein n=1 Tax=Vermiconidia calcicola TaxID=1690605 RepID=A0ACC3NLG7_9PEZI|nr:hypothetical protein LTR37_004970 [Vermiconidia calcicola]